ncbi:DUF2147 domain-containing protein [Prevotella amnii]|uniref:DUF2147 domain-containing protein n=1 Tax=Prevotella amnii TaxID=419005 RepID=UPI00336A7733
MKKMCFMFCLFFAITCNVMGQTTMADKLIGTYLTEGGKAKIAIAKSGNTYYGKLIWSITKNALDKNNPVKSERTKKLAGKIILTGFKYANNDVWNNGKIYDPENGKTYSCKITRKSNGDLVVRGFIGFSLLGRNTTWTRLK